MTVCSEICGSILDACIVALERGVAVELFLDPKNRSTLEKNPFLLHKCLQLINKGASVSLTEPCTDARWYLCMADFTEVRDIAADRMVTYREERNQVDIQNIARNFRALAQSSTPYLAETGDIRMHLSVSEHVIMKGDMVAVTWEVDLADRIVIQGIGEVDAYGSKRLKIDRHTIIRLGAYNERQSQIKAIKIWVSEEIKIAYDIGFLSARTNTYTSLVQAENYPHIYGVAHGNAIRFVWQVSEASEVKILPFNITSNKGEHVFTPVQSQQIVIQARIQGKAVTRKIMVLIFPIPVFRDKLVSLRKNMNEHYRFTLAATVKPALNDNLRKMLSREQRRYQKLNSILYRQYFDVALKRINLERVSAFLFSFLKSKYSGRANIVGIIQSIQDYYNPPKHRQ
jgi:hypothetical protein